MEPTEAVDRILQRSRAAGMECTEETLLGQRAIVARRSDFKLRWMATKLYTFVIAIGLPSLGHRRRSGHVSRGFAAGGARRIGKVPGVPGGLRGDHGGRGGGALARVGSVGRATRSQVAAMTFPVIADPLSGLVIEPGRMLLGAIYVKHLRRVVTTWCAPR